MTLLEENLRTNSPRLSPRPAPFTAMLMWGGAALLLLVLILQAFLWRGVAAWSVGLVYIGYDTALLIFVGYQTLALLKSDLEAVPPGTVHGTLSVIVAAHNEEAVLEPTIEALRRQSSPPDIIILADDGSSDGSAEVLANIYGLLPPALGQLSDPSPVAPELRWLRLPHGGKARALNCAIEHLETDMIVTVDADTIMAPGAIQAMRDAFDREPELVAATGVLHPICGHDWKGRLFQWFQTYEYVRNFLSRYAWMQQNSLLLISGAFAGYRRSALVGVGGFDPAFLVEDYEVIHRLHRHAVEQGVDWRVRVIGGAQASTDSPSAILPFLRQRRRWFGGFLQTQYWNRDMIGNPAYGRLGTEMLSVKAFDTVQPIYGLTAFALLIGFALTGRFLIAGPILIAMGVKIVIDFAYLLWSLHLFRLWTGRRLSGVSAIAAAIMEPFTFQLLRHAGAVWGWIMVLTRSRSWGRQHRAGIEARIGPSASVVRE